MNSVGEVTLDSYLGPTLLDGNQHQRRGAKTLELVGSGDDFLSDMFDNWLIKTIGSGLFFLFVFLHARNNREKKISLYQSGLVHQQNETQISPNDWRREASTFFLSSSIIWIRPRLISFLSSDSLLLRASSDRPDVICWCWELSNKVVVVPILFEWERERERKERRREERERDLEGKRN